MQHNGIELNEFPESLQRFVQGALGGGEVIRWLGRPGKQSSLLMIVVLVVGGGTFLLFCTLVSLIVGGQMILWIVTPVTSLMVLLGLLSIPWNRKQDALTAYVVTNQRALIVRQCVWFFPPIPLDRSELSSYGPERLVRAALMLRRDGSGDLIFESRRRSSSDGGDYVEKIGFQSILNAKAVHKLIRDLTGLQESRSESNRIPTANVSVDGLERAPFLMEPPRRVPFAIQRQLLGNRGIVPVIAGAMFVVVSLIFLVPFLFVRDDSLRDNATYFWRLFPLLHLTVGLALSVTPLVLWRRRVSILRRGRLTAVRIIAYQDANLLGEWVSFDPTSFAQTRWFSDAVSLPSREEQTDQELRAANGLSKTVKLVAGCGLSVVGVFGLVFGLGAIALVWFGKTAQQRTVTDNLLESLVGLGVSAIAIGIPYLMWHGIKKAVAPFQGKAAPGSIGMTPMANFRFAFALPDGTQSMAVSRSDLRTRHREGRTESADLAIYLPDNPQRALLLECIYPALQICHGQLDQRLS